jgi:hypothetical protein
MNYSKYSSIQLLESDFEEMCHYQTCLVNHNRTESF